MICKLVNEIERDKMQNKNIIFIHGDAKYVIFDSVNSVI